MKVSRTFTACGLMAAAVLIADQITKFLVLANIAEGSGVPVLPFFNLVLVWNRGVSFGFMNHGDPISPYILSGISVIISVFLFMWLLRARTAALRLALSAVIAGAAGNVIDRLWHGAVVDFLDFHAFGWHYPSFNIADCAIVLGIAFIVFDGLFLEPKSAKTVQKSES